MWNLTIIPQVPLGYDMIDSQKGPTSTPYKLVYKLSPLNRGNKKKIIQMEKDKAKSVHKTLNSMIQIMTWTGMTQGTFWVNVI